MQKITPKPHKRISARKYRGAGDLVAIIAQPIARAIDAFANTNIQGCQACMKRQDKLNKIAPFR